jgi:hypothetical protein
MFAPFARLFRLSPMRLALLGFAAAFSASSFAAETTAPFPFVSHSNVTLAATYSRAGDFAKTEAKRSDGDYRVSFGFSTIRFGNSDLLDILVAKGVENGGIPEKKGWAVVAVWADWESNGASSYKFFVRKKVAGVYQTKPVPTELLSIELLQPYVIKTVQTRDGQILSGTDRYKAYTSLTLGADSRDPTKPNDPTVRRITASNPLGMISGSGRYLRSAAAPTAFYLPGAATFNGYGISEVPVVGENSSASSVASEGLDVVIASLNFGKAAAISSTQYPAFKGTQPSRGPDSTAVVSR